jgi:hypothetical protein
MTFETFDPRTIGTEVYQALIKLRSPYDDNLKENKIDKDTHQKHLKEQKNQAIELYTYISTWGLMRLRAEELALRKKTKKNEPPINELSIIQKAKRNQEGKREVIEVFFQCLEKLSDIQINNINNDRPIDALVGLDTDTYLGLTGLALEIAQEFSFWANAVYHDISGEE